MFYQGYYPIPPGLDSMKPGIELAALLGGIDVDRVSPDDRIIVLRAHDRMASYYQAHRLRAMASVVDAMAETEDPQFAEPDAAAEIGAALRLTRRAADADLELSLLLRNRVPRVWQAMVAGTIDVRRARVIADGTLHLSVGAAREIVERVIDHAGNLTTGQLRARVQRLCIEVDPDAAQHRYERAVKDRRLVLEPTDQGTANVHGLDLPPHQSASVMRRLNRLAQRLNSKDDPRTMDQIRADLFLSMLGGEDVGTPRAKAVVDIQIPFDTLIGASDDPGELNGYGPVVADIARQVAEEQHDAEWRYSITDSESGQMITSGTTRRRPNAKERRHVEARDRTCMFPGCRMPATNCDLDHRIPWAQGGATRTCDLAALCRHHHVVRHRGWGYRRILDGDYLWTSKLGHNYTTSGRPP